MFVSAILCLILTTGCNKKSNDDDTPSMPLYEVRYTATTQPGETIRLSYRLPDGKTQNEEQTCPDGTFSVTVGPVEKGFLAVITVVQHIGEEPGSLSIETRTGSSPFELKAHNDHAVTLSYTVGD